MATPLVVLEAFHFPRLTCLHPDCKVIGCLLRGCEAVFAASPGLCPLLSLCNSMMSLAPSKRSVHYRWWCFLVGRSLFFLVSLGGSRFLNCSGILCAFCLC